MHGSTHTNTHKHIKTWLNVVREPARSVRSARTSLLITHINGPSIGHVPDPSILCTCNCGQFYRNTHANTHRHRRTVQSLPSVGARDAPADTKTRTSSSTPARALIDRSVISVTLNVCVCVSTYMSMDGWTDGWMDGERQCVRSGPRTIVCAAAQPINYDQQHTKKDVRSKPHRKLNNLSCTFRKGGRVCV